MSIGRTPPDTMDAAVSEKQGARPAGDGAYTTSSAPEVRRPPSSELPVAVVALSGAAEESGGGGEDEQVERFYALLANIRALRNVYGAGGSPSRKRPRVSEEPPWRPKFRMEDFLEADDDAVSAKKGRKEDPAEWRRPENDDDAEDGEVVQENGRVSASQSTRACADSV